MNHKTITSSLLPDFWNGKRYYSFDAYLKKEFHQKIYKLSLNAGMTCPNRDGTLSKDGCIFCSEGGSGDFASSSQQSITMQIEEAKQKIKSKTSCNTYIAYFQAYTNTYAPIPYLKQIFQEAARHPDIAVISIATRPDCLSGDVLALLSEINQIKPVWIELGLQTIHATSHNFIGSRFTLQQFDHAVLELNLIHIPIIVHLILGLPCETRQMMLESVKYIAKQPVDGIKLQLLHVLKNTPLESIYQNELFSIFSLEEYCDFLAECIELLPPELVIHRLTGDGPKNLLISPLWSANKKNVLNQIQKTFKEKNSWQGKLFQSF